MRLVAFFAASLAVFPASAQKGKEKDASGIKSGKLYRIINIKSGHALDVMDGSKIKAIDLIQGKLDAKSESQQWRVVRTNTGYKLVNRNSELPIDIPGGSKKPGERLIQYTDQGGPNQQWLLKKAQRGFMIQSVYSDHVISVANGLKEDGVGVVQLPWSNDRSQIWRFDFVPDQDDKDSDSKKSEKPNKSS